MEGSGTDRVRRVGSRSPVRFGRQGEATGAGREATDAGRGGFREGGSGRKRGPGEVRAGHPAHVSARLFAIVRLRVLRWTSGYSRYCSMVSVLFVGSKRDGWALSTAPGTWPLKTSQPTVSTRPITGPLFPS